MPSFTLTFLRSGALLTACLMPMLLAACGSDVDPVATAQAVEQSQSAALTGSTATTQKSATSATKDTPSTSGADNTAAIPDSRDSRVIYWIDPRQTYAEGRKWNAATQVSGPNQVLADVQEPGIIGLGSDYALSRVADPLDPTKAAFRHRIAEAFPTWGTVGARRSEISADWSSKGATVMRGVDYWIAFAVKFEPDMFGSGNGGASLMDFHQVPDSGENWLPSSLSMYSGDNDISFVVRWDSGQPTVASNPPSKSLWSESAPSTTQWHRFVMKVRLNWDAAQKPYVRIWRAVGNGPVQLIVSHDGPNDYNNNAPYIPQKFGLYRWDDWSGKPTRTMYTKGFYVIKDQPGSPALDEHVLMSLLGKI
ncbi:MAG TPA: heparin lyase I family protein [Thermodesulfobacteriota bacterium]|nr:heparin lyase I family protein [Thermodesulfobacteriota bacterium]HML96716.1 heparin lyase I family protein [Thermodesulfobacteriota bacterium]